MLYCICIWYIERKKNNKNSNWKLLKNQLIIKRNLNVQKNENWRYASKKNFKYVGINFSCKIIQSVILIGYFVGVTWCTLNSFKIGCGCKPHMPSGQDAHVIPKLSSRVEQLNIKYPVTFVLGFGLLLSCDSRTHSMSYITS